MARRPLADPRRPRTRPRSDGPPSPAFVCARCGLTVTTAAAGTRQRNHCPGCLHSVHVDVVPGDRRSLCGGLMEPIAIWMHDDGEVSLLHRCERCGVIRANRVAGDDDEAALDALAERLRAAAGGRRRAGGAP